MVYQYQAYRLHAHRGPCGACQVYAAYTYRRKYVQAAKVRSLAASEPWNIAAASPSLGRHATSHPLDHRGPPDLDPFAMSQQFAWDMVQERILRAMVEPARTTLMQETGSNYVKDVHVALTVRVTATAQARPATERSCSQ